MARLTSFLQWIGGQAGAFGMGTIGQWTITHRDYMLDLFEELTGGRIYHMYIIPGGVRGDLPEGFEDRMEALLVKIEKLLSEIDLAMFHNAVFKMRAEGLGGHHAGHDRSLRHHRARTPAQPVSRGTSARTSPTSATTSSTSRSSPPRLRRLRARLQVRFQEMYQSVSPDSADHGAHPPTGTDPHEAAERASLAHPAGQTWHRAECTRGEYGYYMVADGTIYPRRVYVRGPSYTHAIAVMEKLAVGANIADIASLMVSLHTYPPRSRGSE
ncbi:MAG: hypothetical protein U5L98_07980 [Halomonas sp.]|nr:hypothetical protein [Halomonas sp.]